MKAYLDLVQTILDKGETRGDRTGVGTRSLFGYQYRLDLTQGFPLVTTKLVRFRSVVLELLWFLKGKTNIHDGLGTKIWDEWADASGELGPIYGYQWRSWPDTQAIKGDHTTNQGIDQISNVIHEIKTNPLSRRLIVSAWNVSDLAQMALPPCHVLFQFYVRKSAYLDCQLYQRSADIALGVPFNIASYALLMHIIAQACDLVPGDFIHTFGDVHCYSNHVAGLATQLKRDPRPLPTIRVAEKHWADLVADDITLHNYTPHPAIPFDIAV